MQTSRDFEIGMYFASIRPCVLLEEAFEVESLKEEKGVKVSSLSLLAAISSLQEHERLHKKEGGRKTSAR